MRRSPKAATRQAKSGNAYGGDGGDAKANGGDGDASNNAVVKQHNYVQDDGCGCDSKNHKFDGKRNQHDESSVKNDSDIDQGDNTATGGDATANGGNGGDADTGNTQKFNGNALAFRAEGMASRAPRRWTETGRRRRLEVEAEGGDTTPRAATPTEATAATPRHMAATAMPRTMPL